MPIVKLDNRFIKTGLICPDDKRRIEYCCNETKGLFIEVRKTQQGVGTYYLRYKDTHKKTCTVKIGLTTDIKLSEARDRAKQLRADVSLGSDPKAETLKRKQVPTLSVFMADNYMPYVKQHKRTWGNDEQMFDKHINAEFGHLRLDEIKRIDVESFHLKLRESNLSAATCDHYAKLIRRVLNLAVDWNIIDSNPLARLKLFNEDNQLERYLNDDELSRLLHVLMHDENRMVSSLILFLLSSGARLGEALTATWENVDIEHKTWRVTASVSKSKRMRAIPLNSTAISVLEAVDTRGKFEHVFINTKTGNPYKCIKKTWSRIRDEVGLVKFRLHDLRHNYASMLVNSGRSLYEVQHILGHSDPKVTMRYAHLNTETLHDAVDAASDRLTAASKVAEIAPEPPQTVLRLVASGKN
jgi:integrase